MTVDNDTVADASAFAEVELSEGFDLIDNQFGSPGDRTAMRALNVNTIDEVPDSSWFINRIGVRPMAIAEILRGANKFDPAEAVEWDTLDGGERQRSWRVSARVPRRTSW